MTNSTDRNFLIQELFANLQNLAPNMCFKKASSTEYKSLYHYNGEKGSKGNNQCSVYSNGNIHDYGADYHSSLIDWYAVQYLHGIEGDQNGNFKKICEFLNLTNEEKKQNIVNNAVFKPNTALKEKSQVNVYLTKDKAEFCRLFANGMWLNVNGTIYSQTGNNTLVSYLSRLFQPETLDYVLKRYVVLFNAEKVLFVYVDANYRITSLKEMKYKPDGHRDGIPNINSSTKSIVTSSNTITPKFVKEGEETPLMVFGQQFVKPDEDVYVVESEKTAIMLKCFMVEHGINGEVVAIGGKSNLARLNCIQARNVIYLPDLKKGVTIEQVKTGAASLIADVDCNKLKVKLEELKQRGIKASYTMDFHRNLALNGLLTDAMLESGLDVGDIVELQQMLFISDKPLICAPESPQTIPGARKIATHPLVDLSVLEYLAKRTRNGLCLVRYGFEMFQQNTGNGDVVLTFDFHAFQDQWERIMFVYNQDANLDIVKENIRRLFYSVFGVNYE